LVENLGFQPVATFSVSSESTLSTPAPLTLDSPNNASIPEATANIFCIRFQKPQDLINTLLNTESPQNRTFLKYLILTNNIYFLKAALAQVVLLIQKQTITTKSLTTCKCKLLEELTELAPLVKNDSSLVIFFNNVIQACCQD